jgi:hypothetical protein
MIKIEVVMIFICHICALFCFVETVYTEVGRYSVEKKKRNIEFRDHYLAENEEKSCQTCSISNLYYY